jgi:hypothetical protein
LCSPAEKSRDKYHMIVEILSKKTVTLCLENAYFMRLCVSLLKPVIYVMDITFLENRLIEIERDGGYQLLKFALGRKGGYR